MTIRGWFWVARLSFALMSVGCEAPRPAPWAPTETHPPSGETIARAHPALAPRFPAEASPTAAAPVPPAAPAAAPSAAPFPGLAVEPTVVPGTQRIRAERYDYSFVVPNDADVTEAAAGMIVDGRFGSRRAIEGLIVLVPRATLGAIDEERIARLAASDLEATGARIVERRTRFVDGRTLPVWIYDDPTQGTRGEWIAIPRSTYALAISFTTDRASFDDAATARDEFFASLSFGDDFRPLPTP